MIRQLKALEESVKPMDAPTLTEHGWLSYELMLAPFSNLKLRNPPGWFFRLYVDSMIRVMADWRAALESRGGEFYLAMWLFEPRQAKSQVVAAVDHRIDYYKSLFRDRAEGGRFPQAIHPYKNQYVWQAKWDYEPHFKDSDELTPEKISELRRKGAYEEMHSNESVFFMPRGTVWVLEERAKKG